MAAGKKEERKNEDEEAAAATAAAAKQKKKKLFLFIGLGVLLVLISVGATFFIVHKMMAKSGDEEEVVEETVAEEKQLPAIYYPLKPNFTVNYDVNGRQRFLQTELTLMYRDEAVLKVLELHMPEVRNGLVMLLSNQSFDELQTTEGKEKLRALALKTVQDIIVKESTAGKEKSKDEEEKPKEKSKDKKSKSKDKEKAAEKEKVKEKPEPNIEQVLFTQFVMQ